MPFPMRIPKHLIVLFVVLAAIGFADSAYLTAEHVRGVIPPCTVVSGCQTVLTSSYATVAGVPVAAAGLAYYAALLILLTVFLDTGKRAVLHWACWLTTAGLLGSAYLVAVQVFVLKAFCLYCLASAVVSVGLFTVGTVIMRRD